METEEHWTTEPQPESPKWFVRLMTFFALLTAVLVLILLVLILIQLTK